MLTRDVEKLIQVICKRNVHIQKRHPSCTITLKTVLYLFTSISRGKTFQGIKNTVIQRQKFSYYTFHNTLKRILNDILAILNGMRISVCHGATAATF